MAYQRTIINGYEMGGKAYETFLLVDDAGIRENLRFEVKYQKPLVNVVVADRDTAFAQLRNAAVAEQDGRGARRLQEALDVLASRKAQIEADKETVRQAGGSIVEVVTVRQYAIITKDITKTNIGTAYVNIPVGASGERALIDCTGCTEYRLILHANLIGTGPFGFRLIRDSDNAVLYENASVALTGERELDSNWQPLPAAASGLILVRLQGKSVTAADDPILRRCFLSVR